MISSLRLLDLPQIVYKFVLSAAQRSALWEASGIERRRLDSVPIRWLTDDLISIVERHLAVATGGRAKSLADLCDDSRLADWLKRTGGDTPRGWLAEARPLVAYYFARARTISAEDWKGVRKQRPPQLVITDRIVVGHREINDMSAGDLAVLHYLFENRGRICTRDELFHKAYLPGTNPDSSKSVTKEFPKEFAGTFDNVLWRLRSAIEPDPDDPIYVITYRGQGVRLENA